MRSTFRMFVLGSLVIGAALVAPPAQAQVGYICALGPTGGFNPAWSTAPTPTALTVGRQVFSLLCPQGCGTVILYQNPTTPNALTMTAGNGVSNVVYSPTFMNTVQATFGEGATFGILAHEIGHHIDLNSNFQAAMSTSWSRELRADAWAGCAMARARLGTASLNNALKAIAAYPSPSHPAWQLRVPAVDFGYRTCSPTATPSPTATTTTTAAPTTPAPAPKMTPCMRKCKRALDACMDDVTTMDDCIAKRIDGCIEICQTKYKHTEDECTDTYCTESDNNMSVWRPRCQSIIKDEKKDCTDDYDDCTDACN